MSKIELDKIARGADEYPPEINRETPRPETWGECHERGLGTSDSPCPYVSCAYHLYLDVDRNNGSLHLSCADVEPDELEHTCALRVAEMGGATLEVVGVAISTTRERVRQLEERAMKKIRSRTRLDKDLDAVLTSMLEKEGPEPWESTMASRAGG